MILQDEELTTQIKCLPCKKGSPLWMSTFADMATLLMAFFVLLVAFADMNMGGSALNAAEEEDGSGQQSEKPIVEYPDGQERFSTKIMPSAVFDGSNYDGINIMPGSNPDKGNSPVEVLKMALAKEIAFGQVTIEELPQQIIVQVATPDISGSDRTGQKINSREEISAEELAVYAKVARLNAALNRDILVERTNLSQDEKKNAAQEALFADQYRRIHSELVDYTSKGLVSVIREGDKIIIRLADKVSFGSGQAKLRPSVLPTLDSIGSALIGVAGTVKIEGHTDNIPLAFNEVYRSNWDLSSARAAAVAERFVTHSALEKVKFMVSGLSDIQPLDTNATREGRSRNRRIEIIIQAE
jgi:chemotaxis protein MotB